MNNRSNLMFLLVLVVVCYCPPVEAQKNGVDDESQKPDVSKVKKGKVPMIAAVGELVKDGDEYVATVELGSLDVSTKLDVEITFKNPYDEPVQFHNVSKKCSCSAFRPGAYKIPPHGEDKVKMTIKVPARSRDGLGTQKLTFVQRGKTVIRTTLKYKLNGVLAFTQPMGFMEFAADEIEKEFQIPFVVTDPVKFEGVTVEASENLKDVVFSTSRTDDVCFVTAKVPDSVLSSSKVSGEVYISSPDVKSKDGYFLVIKDLAKHVISPGIATFRKKEGQMVCTAIVQIAGRSGELPTDPIECRFEDQLIATELKLLKKNTIRVQLRLSDELAQKMSATVDHSDENAKPKKLVWSINNGMKVSKQEMPFVIDQN